MKLGVCYYPEHWPEERWPIDARIMREAGLSLVRIGEFSWTKMEPQEGHFEWDWLDKAIQTLADEGLQVILGTPTCTPPAWLCTQHPEILPVDAQGRRRRFGSRRHYCHNSLVYQQHTTRIVTALVQRYGQHPAVIGWQIDNEFGLHDSARCYCENCTAAFRAWLQQRYNSLEALNQAWGCVFWNQTYTDWEQIGPPILAMTEQNPSAVLDYYRFASDSVAAYAKLQADLLCQHTHNQFVTHNFMGSFPDLDYHALAQPVDFISWDSYPTGHAEMSSQALYLPGEMRPPYAFDAGDPYVTGFCHDLMRGLKQAPFWVMEQQCGNVNWGTYNTGIHPGAVRLWTWHALASGAKAVLYFRWRAGLYAQEQYHSGLLNHDASDAVGIQDVRALFSERKRMAEIADQPWQAPVALLMDYNDLWAIQIQPHRKDFDYQRHLFVFYRALLRLGVQVDIISPQADLSAYKLVIAPTLFMSDERLAEHLNHYVEGGGALLMGVRSGFKTPTNQVTSQPLPGALHELTGARVTAWHALPEGVGYEIESSIPDLNGSGPASFWAEALEPDPEPSSAWKRARVLARYRSGPFEDQAALIERTLGAGRVLYLGWYPKISQARALMSHLAASLEIETLPTLPEGLIHLRRGPYQILLNFTERAISVRLAEQEIIVEARGVKLVSSVDTFE